jgi:Ca2+-binding RTX toxin-like protein
MMYSRTRLAVLTGAALLSASWLAGGGVATASTPLLSCDGLPVTIEILQPNLVTAGTTNADVILGTSGVDTINADDGDDVVCAGGGNDIVTGDADNDRVFGAHGADRIAGNDGDDEIFGEADNDDMRGGAGDDLLDGGPNNMGGDRGNGGPQVTMNGDDCPNTETVVGCNP